MAVGTWPSRVALAVGPSPRAESCRAPARDQVLGGGDASAGWVGAVQDIEKDGSQPPTLPAFSAAGQARPGAMVVVAVDARSSGQPASGWSHPGD